jgi:hypothetical protein
LTPENSGPPTVDPLHRNVRPAGPDTGSLHWAVTSTTSPGLIEPNAACTEGMSGTRSANRLLAATSTINAIPAARKFY